MVFGTCGVRGLGHRSETVGEGQCSASFFLTLWFMKRFGENLVKNCCSRGCLWPIQLVFHQSTGLLIELEVREDEKSEKLRISGDFYLGHFHINIRYTYKIKPWRLVRFPFRKKKTICNFEKVGWNSTWTSKSLWNKWRFFFNNSPIHGRFLMGALWTSESEFKGNLPQKLPKKNWCFFLGIDSLNQATICFLVSWWDFLRH